MSITRCVTVEFEGGPLDGFRQEVASLPADGASLVALPINANIVRVISGGGSRHRRPASSVAIYELQGCDGHDRRQRYQYVGPAAVEDFHLQAWVG